MHATHIRLIPLPSWILGYLFQSELRIGVVASCGALIPDQCGGRIRVTQGAGFKQPAEMRRGGGITRLGRHLIPARGFDHALRHTQALFEHRGETVL